MEVSTQLGLCRLVALAVKKLPEPACQCRRRKRHRFDPQVRKFPQSRWWQPTPAFLPGEVYGQRSLAGYCPWGHKELDMTEVTWHAQAEHSRTTVQQGRNRCLKEGNLLSAEVHLLKKIISPEVESPAEEGVGSQRNENKSWRVMVPGRSWTRCWGKRGHRTQASAEQLGPSHALRLRSWTWPTPRSPLSIRRPKLIWKLLTFLSNCKLIWPRANDCQRWSHCAEFSFLAQILQLKEISEI